MSLSRTLAAVLLLAALAVPATADAAPAARTSARVAAPADAAAAVAGRYWGAVPCQGKVTILAQRPLTAGLSSDTDAWVTFDSALGANNLSAPPSSYTNCAITLARWRWPTSASMVEDWDMLCTTMTHEWGHLLGHVHDSTPHSLMAPVFADTSSVPPICRDARPSRATRPDRRRGGKFDRRARSPR